MSVDVFNTRFVFCNESEARSIRTMIDDYNSNHNQNYQCSSITYQSYDHVHQGLILLGVNRDGRSPDLTESFAGQYKSLRMWFTDCNAHNRYTDDNEHIIFQKYYIDEVPFKSKEEFIQGLVEHFDDSPLNSPDAPRPDCNFEVFFDYCVKEYCARGVLVSKVQTYQELGWKTKTEEVDSPTPPPTPN